jgi:UDP-glucose 4-epimerase
MQDIQQIFEENQIDQVFHFLNTTIPATSEDIRFDIESNLLATIGLLENMYSFNVQKIIFISSGGAIYGNTQGLYHSEGEDPFPISSYGIVKLAIEKYIHMFSKRSNITYLILRLSNPFGLFHYSTKQGLINAALRKMIQQETLAVWGDGTNKKDYIFVEDFVEILMKLIDINVANEIINIGSGNSYSINEILEKIKLFDSTFSWDYIDKKEFDNITFKLNLTKLKKLLPDYNFTPLDVGIKKTFDWLINGQIQNND